MAKAHGFSHASVICAHEHQRAHEPCSGWCAWSKYHVQAGGSLPLHPYFFGVADYFGISPFQITPNGIQGLVALYVIYHSRGWKPPTPHEVRYLFDMKTNLGQKNIGFFHLFHRQKGVRYLHGISHKSNAGKYFSEYFTTSDIRSAYTSFIHAGPFIQPLPTRAMKSRVDILVGLPSEEKDVKVLATAKKPLAGRPFPHGPSELPIREQL